MNNNESGKFVYLSTIDSGSKVKVVKIDAGKGLNSRLAAMGLIPGSELTLIRNGNTGPFTINIKGVKVALGRAIAHKIQVQAV